jgi:hypothetical protein
MIGRGLAHDTDEIQEDTGARVILIQIIWD